MDLDRIYDEFDKKGLQNLLKSHGMGKAVRGREGFFETD